MTLDQRRTLIKAFNESQFGSCPLIWMFCGRNSSIPTVAIKTLFLTKTVQCLQIMEIFAYLQFKFTKLRTTFQLL